MAVSKGIVHPEVRVAGSNPAIRCLLSRRTPWQGWSQVPGLRDLYCRIRPLLQLSQALHQPLPCFLRYPNRHVRTRSTQKQGTINLLCILFPGWEFDSAGYWYPAPPGPSAVRFPFPPHSPDLCPLARPSLWPSAFPGYPISGLGSRQPEKVTEPGW